jgi:hypothetical protein
MSNCTLQNKEYGHFIDIEKNYIDIYPNNLKLMKKKYKIPIDYKIMFKKCKSNMKYNVHIMKTIPEKETKFKRNTKSYFQFIMPSCLIASIICSIYFYYII